MSQPRCVVLVPYLTHVEPACDRGLHELERRGLEVRRYASTAAVDRTRSEMATKALGDGFEELMWIDSDVVFDPADVDRLRTHAPAIVGGVYAKKGSPGFALHPDPATRELVLGTGGGLTPVRYVGAGFLLTRRAVYVDIANTFSLPLCNMRFGAPVVPYFLPMVITDDLAGRTGYWYLGEDYAFCERARLAGHRVAVDTSIRLGHIGAYTYRWEDGVVSKVELDDIKLQF